MPLETSRCLEDFRSRLLAGVEDEKHRKWLEKEAPVWIGICDRVEWKKLLSREVVLAARADERRRQWIGLFRVDPLERDGIVSSIERVLYALGSISPEIELIHSRRENESVTALYKRTIDPLEDVTGVPPFILGALDAALSDGRDLSVAGKGDVVLLSTSANLLQRSLQLLEGAGSDLGFAHTARRESRLAAGKLAAPGGAGFEIHADPGALFPEVDALGALGPFTATGKLEGASLAYGFHAALAGEARGEAAALRNALAEVPPLGNVLDRIPADATGFYAASMPRVGVLLGVVESVWKKVAPDAGELVEDEGVRRNLRELSPRGFLAQLPGSWFGYSEGFPVPSGAGAKWFDALLAVLLQGVMASRGGESRMETASSGAVILEMKGTEGGTLGYVGWRQGRLAASKTSKELVVAALECGAKGFSARDRQGSRGSRRHRRRGLRHGPAATPRSAPPGRRGARVRPEEDAGRPGAERAHRGFAQADLRPREGETSGSAGARLHGPRGKCVPGPGHRDLPGLTASGSAARPRVIRTSARPPVNLPRHPGVLTGTG